MSRDLGMRLRACALGNELGKEESVYRRGPQFDSPDENAVLEGARSFGKLVLEMFIELDAGYDEVVEPWPKVEDKGVEFLLLKLKGEKEDEGEGFGGADEDAKAEEYFRTHSIINSLTGDVYSVSLDDLPEYEKGIRANVRDAESMEKCVDPKTGGLKLFGENVINLVRAVNVDIDSANDFGETSLYLASKRAHVKLCKWLIDNGADCNFATQAGVTPLLIATDSGSKQHLEVIQLLVKSGGANVNHANIWGMTALHVAAFRGNLEVCKLLLELGADQSLQDKKGRTPAWYTTEETCERDSSGKSSYNAEVEKMLG
uniref:Uncharacterized protein n=1 Tax=Mucochytrium quahogii TaxID=96639 RepID=A0A7S2RZ72_9STRA|mmetsp:Transcript_20133/g.33253  ORF Transcript_20133/g.33253 Transcript_20133/m.33253 type:complete len:316 (+) Transcript_20133:52-999(+)|eukprot:CAMPEP_0203760700 /NCGR_PEP_ID=MMETSP0098-20131031/13944_1 /ASSEMBLY_ACC=CAM_ASM_000208 /TAXON_ID=96639 /ORGANISM=" , Strain NY0313808BC1" /LENGTH=315 /DNA_ID=CAMNT_0050654383 /DNA_START=43 /DNA_END=990 /DNA_ORIENTATION=+